MLKGKYFAGMLSLYIMVFVIGFYFAVPRIYHFVFMVLLLLVFGISIFRKNDVSMQRDKRFFVFLLALILLVFSFGYSEWILETRVHPIAQYQDGEIHSVEAEVSSVRYETSFGSSYVLQVKTMDGNELSTNMILELPFPGGLAQGDRIAFEGIPEALTDEYRYYHYAKGILVSCEAQNFVYEGMGSVSPSFFDGIRQHIAEIFQEYLHDGAGYASALLLGEKDDLDAQTMLSYQRLGISHVLAVSGMHFSVIIGGFDFLLRSLTVPKKRKNLVLIALAWVFAGICGFSASVMRALIMFCIYYLADTFGEKSDSLTSLFFAAACIITVNPLSVFDGGFWLSILSTLGIVLVMPSMSRLSFARGGSNRLLRFFRKSGYAVLCMMVMNVTAIFFTMPVAYFLYGGISLISPLANLIFIPLTELILYLLILLLVISFCVPMAGALGALCDALIGVADQIARPLSDLRGIYLSIRYPFVSVLLGVMILAVLAVLWAKEFRLRRMFAVFFSLFIAFGVCLGIYTYMDRDSTHLYICTDGKNDVISLLDEGEVMMIDVTNGGKRVPTMATQTLVTYYRCEIDTYVLTHLHSYHAGTLRAIADDMKLHRVLIPEPKTEKDTEYACQIEEALEGICEIAYYERNGTQCVSVGDTEVFLPSYQTISRSTHPILTFSGKTEGVDSWVYFGACAMEFPSNWEMAKRYRTVIFGAHGPIVKNIFDDDCLAMTELVVFTSADTASLVNLEKCRGETVLAKQEYRIRFAH